MSMVTELKTCLDLRDPLSERCGEVIVTTSEGRTRIEVPHWGLNRYQLREFVQMVNLHLQATSAEDLYAYRNVGVAL